MNKHIITLLLAVFCAMISLMFGIVGAHGDDVAMLLSFYMVGFAGILTLVGFILLFFGE